MPHVLGLDIGGANLKAAHSTGTARTIAFPLWKYPDRLTVELERLCKESPPHDMLAVTMTGELCDCFANRREGVMAILQSVEAIAHDTPVRIWTTRGAFADLHEARTNPLSIASANWLALAHFVAKQFPAERVLLIDAGSTTTDILYLNAGLPDARGYTDADRLAAGELVYTGVRRTPLCAVLGMQVAAELFATMQDAYVFMDLLPESVHDTDTADGRPATRGCAHARLARMACADVDTFSSERARALAETALQLQWTSVVRAIDRVLDGRPPVNRIVLSGSGEILGQAVCIRQPKLVNLPITSLSEMIGRGLSEAACAYAVAMLAKQERPVTQPATRSLIVVKVGGSLFALPDLRERLHAWLAQRGAANVVFVPGGGITAEAIRAFDHTHKLGEEASHWLAIRTLSVNAHFLRQLLPGASLLTDLPGPDLTGWHILDAYPFFQADERSSDHLPHHWQVTSDSLALRAAVLLHANELLLLKSVDCDGSDWPTAQRGKLVDAHFSDALRQAPAALQVRIVNLRTWAM